MGSMRKSHLSDYKQHRLIEHFVLESTVGIASGLCGVNRKAAAFFPTSARDHRLRTGTRERSGQIYPKIIPDAESAALMPIIQEIDVSGQLPAFKF